LTHLVLQNENVVALLEALVLRLLLRDRGAESIAGILLPLHDLESPAVLQVLVDFEVRLAERRADQTRHAADGGEEGILEQRDLAG
jgi:hypothetical protein